jgi:hypothetical protein
VYNGTGTNYENTGLTQGTTYYYRAWSFTKWTYNPTIYQWSDNNASTTNSTNHIPTITNPYPANGSTGIPLTPTLNITINDLDGDTMTLLWSSNSSGTWKQFGQNNSCVNGTYRWTNTNFSSPGTKYYWRVNVTDGLDTNYTIYSFTTDGTPPISSVDTITPYWKKSSPLTITVTAADTGSGLKNVTLYYYNSTNNVTWRGPWKFHSTNITPWITPTWYFNFPNGTGYYRFYSRAADNATNMEAAPAVNDTKCGYDTTAPASSVNAISPYWKTSSPQTISGTASDTGPSGLKNVTLWYQHRTTNTSSWGGWARWNNAGNPDTTPWSGVSWSFNFPNGTGHYQFYSIAADNATNAESAPGGNGDANCGYDNLAPTSSVDAITPYWKKTSPLTITVTASDTGYSGLKNVTLYYYNSTNNATWRGPWKFGNTNSTPWITPIRWNFNFPNGTGYYRFYSRAYDNATNQETFTGNDTKCGYDNVAPTSSVTAITPYWKKAAATITATATDATSGVKNVTLWYRFSSNNASWGGWVSGGVDTALPWSWSFSFSNGSGYYQFYSIAKDNATNAESAPGSADAKCGYDNVAPTSSVNPISPYINTTGTVELTATASDALSGVKNVTLWYRYSTDNSSWGAWTRNITDTDYSWNWTFTSPNGTGYYEFYSIAYDNVTNNELAPGSADARYRYLPNQPPVVSNPDPTDAETGVSVTKVNVSVYISDPDGDLMNWTIEVNNSDSSFGNNAGNGTIDCTLSIPLANSCTYTWWVNVTDGISWTNVTYIFITIGANKQIISKGRDAYSLEISPGGTTLYGYVNGNSVQTSIDTNWHYVTLTYDGSQLRIYKDGEFKANTSMTGNINTNANDLLLGRYLTGTLDEVRISSTARSAAWINTTYRNTNSPATFAIFGDQIGILSTWMYRKQITISASMTSSDLTNFPVLISTTDTDLKNNALTNGYDILFTNSSVDWTGGSTAQKLDHEIEKYNSATGELVAWVKIPLLSSTSNTVIYMYYGNSLCTANRQNPTEVWDDDFVGVWHLSETPSDGGTNYDSTARNHDLTFHDVVGDSNTNANGIANGADDLSGDADYMGGSQHSDFNLSTFTLECWVTLDDKTNTHFMINKELDDYTDRNFALYSNKTTGLPTLVVRTTSGVNVTRDGTTDLTSTGWHYIAGTNNGTGTYTELYVNGTSEDWGVMSANPPATQSAPLMVGRENSSSTPNYWDGKIDEIRISKIARDESWINTTYNTIGSPSTFLAFGPQKTRNVPPAQGSPSPSDGATGQSLNPQLSITVNDTNADAMNVTFRTTASGAWATIGSNNSVYNGTYRWTPSNMNSYGATYHWSVNVTDGTVWTNATYSFTTYSLLTIRPNAAGRSTQLTKGPPTGPAANYMCVDDVAQNGDADYVFSDNQATYINDTYNLTDHAAESGNINFIKIYLCGKKYAVGGGGTDNTMKPMIYTNNQYYDSDIEVALTNSYATSSWTHNINPVTSSAWTWSEIDNLEVGVALKGQANRYTNCTQAYVEVIYTSS